ncbi:MAG TPA: ribonuclease HII [Thermoanaerobaculia bacterium]|nr:ribonuclease HII [Thermoanaerobaculia bacterium]
MRKSARTDARRSARDKWTAALLWELERLSSLTAPENQLFRRGYRRIAGTDEVGRGCLAGPVVAAAVILPPGFSWPGIDDSKKLEAEEREAIAEVVRGRALAAAVAVVSVREIDETDIRLASLAAMRQALDALDPVPEIVLTDAFLVPGWRGPQIPIVHGDARSISIAAASILAKVHRDALMDEIARRYPAYAFERHKGYAVAEHREILARIGPCPEHRLSFHGVIPDGEIV